MSNVCCKEFSGWFKSFTKIERVLAVLEAVLLVVLVVLLVLLILHLIVCSKLDERDSGIEHTSTPPDTALDDGRIATIHGYPINPYDRNRIINSSHVNEMAQNGTSVDSASVDMSTKSTESGMKCSWIPSAKTTAAIHYYEDGSIATDASVITPIGNESLHIFTPDSSPAKTMTVGIVELETDLITTEVLDYSDEFIMSDHSDGEDAEDEYRSYVLALAKLKPPKDVIFGCILTIVTEYWTLTAASCIEAIEEVDSLDSFVIMEQYGSNKRGPLQTIDDVQIHPFYEGKNKSYDLAALKSAGSLTKRSGSAVELASMLDYSLITIGESFTILGYGAYRSIDKSPSGRRLRRAAVHVVPARACAAAQGAELRHLVAAGGARRAACGVAALCAGALWARGLPCNYCSGTPLLRGAVLFAVMADNSACGVACEPQLYAAVPPAADWIRATVGGE